MLSEIILGGAIILLLAWLTFKKPSGLPPGKWGLPLIGYIPLNGKYIDDHLNDFHKKYGDIYSWRFGQQLQVYVHDYDICKQMFSSSDFVNRPVLQFLKADSGDLLGIFGSNGSIWRTNRRFCLRQLRDLGMGKSRMVSAIQEQASTLLEALKESCGKEETITPALNTGILNVVWKLIADKQFESSDPRHKDLHQLMIRLNEAFVYSSFADMFSWVMYVVPPSVFRRMFKLDTEMDAQQKFFKYFDELIVEHQQKLDPENPKDLMDAYLIEMNERKDKQEAELEGVRSLDDLKYLLLNLFIAGGGTTKDTLEWLFLYMAAFPDKQRKLQREIDMIIKKDVLATMDDRLSMPYTEAVINELLRKSSLVNIGVHHSAVEDTILVGYKIPKGTMITSASGSIHHDERYWDKPDRFLPERWISPEGKFVMKKEGFLPFSIGKRSCIAEGMARMELFIFATAVFQSFSVAPPEGKLIDLLPDYNIMFGHFPRKQELVFSLRA